MIVAVHREFEVGCNLILCSSEPDDGEVNVGSERIDEESALFARHGWYRNSAGSEIYSAAVSIVKVISEIITEDGIHLATDREDKPVVGCTYRKLRSSVALRLLTSVLHDDVAKFGRNTHELKTPCLENHIIVGIVFGRRGALGKYRY